MEKKTRCHTRSEGDGCNGVRSMLNRIALFVLSFFMLVAAMPASAAAEETTAKEGWKFDANLYLWGSSINGKTTNGDTLDVSFSDLLKNLKMGFMGGAGASNGKWHFTADVLYLKLKADNSKQLTAFVGPRENEIKIKVDATVKLQGWVVSPIVGYRIFDNDKVSLEVLAGARYLWLKPELDLKSTGPLQVRNKKISDSGDVWDGIVGIRGNVNLDNKWYVPYYADMGAGDSILTCQAMTGVGYKISKAVDVVAAYRYLYWKFADSKVLDKLSFSGPLVGVRYRF